MPASTTSRPSASSTSSSSRASASWRSHRRQSRRSASRSLSYAAAKASENPETGEIETLMTRAEHVQGGAAGRPRHPQGLRHRRQEPGRAQQSTSTCRLLFGGQIKGGKMRLFMIYSAGNFIEAHRRYALSADRRAQIRQADPRPRRELQHRPPRRPEARPDLDGFDHALEPRRRHADRHAGGAARRLDAEINYRIEPGEPYFHDLRERWSAALRAAHQRDSAPALPTAGR